MNIELLELSSDGDMVKSEVFDFSPDFFIRLSKSDFSKLGISKKKKVSIDGENIELKLCEFSPFIRNSIVSFLEVLLVDVVTESMNNLGLSPSKNEFEEYTYDLKELARFITSIRITSYSHLNRVG